MYRSPIDIIYADMSSYIADVAKKVDEDIWQAIVRYDVNIDKDELIRALRYDRDQYKKGYADGEADATPKWISVKDRLPELHTKVLCCGIKGGRFIAELGTWGHERHLYWDKKNGRGCPEVTHWMPLPEPPKEDDHGKTLE